MVLDSSVAHVAVEAEALVRRTETIAAENFWEVVVERMEMENSQLEAGKFGAVVEKWRRWWLRESADERRHHHWSIWSCSR